MPITQFGAEAAVAYTAARTVAEVVKTAAGAETWLSRLLTLKQGPRRALAPLYYEILYNMSALWYAQRMRPPTMIVTRAVWNTGQHQMLLGQLFDPAQIGVISSPYLQLDTYEWFFRQDPLWLLRARFEGEDQRMIEKIRQAFRDAEAMMRPKIFSRKPRERLGKYLRESGVLESPSLQPQVQRILGIADSVALPVLGWIGANFVRPYLVRWGILSDDHVRRSTQPQA